MCRGVLRRARRFLSGAGACLLAAAAIAGDGGTLVIGGGAVRPDNAAVWERFIGAIPEGGRIAVITGASGEASASADSFVRTVERYGVAPRRIDHVRLALIDDPATPDVDESRWAAGAAEPSEIAKIDAAAGIWFTGGDQLRLTTLLFDGDGRPTPMLSSIRERFAAGAAVGGSSAGAAIMSDPMIGRGESLAALLDTADAGELLLLNRGFDFFARGIVDQHFDASARLGRLAVALGDAPAAERLGFGIDEDTAMLVDAGGSTIEVVGRGSLSVLDGRKATWQDVEGGVRIENLSLSVMQPGDRLDLETMTLDVSERRSRTVGNEYFDRPGVAAGGMAVPGGTLAELLGRELLDNAGATVLTRYSFIAGDDVSAGIAFRFTQQAASQGFWGRDEAGDARYTIAGVRFDIFPVALDMVPAR